MVKAITQKGKVMSSVDSKRVDDSFLRKVVWTLIGLVITQWIGIGVAFGMYAQQVTDNTAYRMTNGSVQDIAAAVSKGLEVTYMTRAGVERVIKEARVELLADQRVLIIPINKRLEGMEQDIKYLVRREIAKGDRK